MQQLSIDGKKINFVEKNLFSTNTILFLHGNSHSLKSFSEQLDSPQLKNYRLVFIDLLGHGDSSADSNYSLKNLSELVGHFTRALDLKNVIIVGHSLGGHIAINTISQTSGLNPLGLFIFGTPPLKNPFDTSAFLPNANAKALGQINPSEEEIESFLNEMGYVGEAKNLALKEFLNTDSHFRQSILADVINGKNLDEVNLMHSFIGHSMFLLATKDRLINNDYIKNVLINSKDLIKTLEIETGHCPQTERPEEFNTILSNFCEFVFNKNLVNNIINKELKHENTQYEQRD